MLITTLPVIKIVLNTGTYHDTAQYAFVHSSQKKLAQKKRKTILAVGDVRNDRR
jgi:hypothetical protein